MKGNNKILFIPLLLTAVFLATSCTSNKSKENKATSNQYLRLDSLAYYNPYNREPSTKFDFVITKYVNVSCPNCVGEIKQLSAVSKKLPNCKIRLVCQSEDKFLYFKYLINENKFSQTDFPFLLDTANALARQNPELKMDLSKVVIITDRENRILKIVALNEKIIESTIKDLK